MQMNTQGNPEACLELIDTRINQMNEEIIKAYKQGTFPGMVAVEKNFDERWLLNDLKEKLIKNPNQDTILAGV